MKKFAKKIGQILKNLLLLRFDLLTFNIVPLLIFEVIYRVLSVFCVVPFIENTVQACAKLSGFEYLNDSNFIQVISQPISILFAILLLILIALYCLIEFSALIYIFEKSRRSQKVTLYEVVYFALHNGFRLFKPKNLPLFFFLLILNPLFNVGVTSSFLDINIVPNFVSNKISQNYWLFLIVVAIFVIAIIFAFRWVYCLHFFTLEQTSGGESFGKSARLTRKHRFLNFLSMQVIQIVIGLLNSFMVFISGLLINNVYDTIDYENALVEIGSFVLLVVFFAVYFILFSLYMPLSCLKVSSLYYSNKQASKQSLSDIKIDEISLQKKAKKHQKNSALKYKKIATIVIISVLAFMAAFFGIKYILTEINDTSEDMADTAVISSESNMVTDDVRNTIDRSFNSGADAFLLEVFISGNGEPFCITNKMFLTAFDSQNFNYKEASLAEIKEFMNIMTKNESGQHDNRIMSLQEFLDHANTIDIDLILDIRNSEWYDGVQQIILDYVAQHYTKSTLGICSNNIDSLSKVKEISTTTKTIYSQVLVSGNFDSFRDTVDYIMLDSVSLTRMQVSSLHKSGFGVIVWSNKNKRNIRSAQNYGVDAVYVTNARSAVNYLEDSNDMELAETAFKRYAFISLFGDLIW